MFGNQALIQQNLNHTGRSQGSQQLRRRAAQAFWHLHLEARLNQFWARLRGRNSELQSLPAHAITRGHGRRRAGVQLIPIAHICGSEGRVHDFDNQFRPLRTHNMDRWINLAVARARGVHLPPVELIQVGDAYYIRDGHHRLSVAQMQGQVAIEAHVIVW